MNSQRIDRIRERLVSALDTSALEIVDESHLHVGHPGAKDGRGHFRIRIVSPSFGNARRLQRHRMVYDALEGLMATDIHALSIEALSPDEARDSIAKAKV